MKQDCSRWSMFACKQCTCTKLAQFNVTICCELVSEQLVVDIERTGAITAMSLLTCRILIWWRVQWLKILNSYTTYCSLH